MIKFVCSSCGERLSVPDQHAGRKGICPNCHAVNRIPLKGFTETQPKNEPVGAPITPSAADPAGTALAAAAEVFTPPSVAPRTTHDATATGHSAHAPASSGQGGQPQAASAPSTPAPTRRSSPESAPTVPPVAPPRAIPPIRRSDFSEIPPTPPEDIQPREYIPPPQAPVRYASSTDESPSAAYRYTIAAPKSPPADAPIEPSTDRYAELPETDNDDLVAINKERRLPKPVKTALLIVAALALVAALYFALLFALSALVPKG